jgi:hypothetical protein
MRAGTVRNAMDHYAANLIAFERRAEIAYELSWELLWCMWANEQRQPRISMKPDQTRYEGERFPDPDEGQWRALVTVDGEYLDHLPSCKLRNHSPYGPNWGYAGSGPAQLALMILLDFVGDEGFALHHYQEFKRQVIARIDQERNWVLLGGQIREVLEELQAAWPYVPPMPEQQFAEDDGGE